jgi:N-acetyl-D-muramate 6-phosphate phosphatase
MRTVSTSAHRLSFTPAAILFDLDGTLADTAADLAAPVNAMRIERGLAALPVDDLRPFASMGARGLIGKGLNIPNTAPEYEALRVEFLTRYEAAMVVHTKIFDGFDEVLETLEQRRIAWGIVSNKAEKYVRPILAQLGLSERAICAVGGDTSGFAKPHPEPLLYACRHAKIDPRECVYVGDDLRDIEAGRAAGMQTIAASYGFCGEHDPPEKWGADFIINHPLELLSLL